jgi:hypothetical protein
VFDLLGVTENDITYSLGFTLARCPTLLAALTATVMPADVGPARAVHLQQSARHGGFTDVEIVYADGHLIAEAKRGWVLPTVGQLRRYRPRIADPAHGRLLSLSECSPAYAAPPRLPAAVDDVPVSHLSWRGVADLVLQARRTGRGSERRLLDEFSTYLRGVVTSQNLFSAWTYCVSVGPGSVQHINFRNVVTVEGRYFHPYGGDGGWPTTPPNLLAFRWNSAVRQVHHVENYRVVASLRDVYADLSPSADVDRQHLVYELGPDLMGGRALPNGANYRAIRMWVALDLLLTSPTLKDAYDSTQRRRVRRAEEPA